ncbi:uncharacterized protein LOC111019038 [Momordica charantia]|uniref:Uncharacterized protein LOC111019038 n=1 Tax=Momordica charantia TaxID=3673 RepID=A0A6J1DBS4_MOMCH|nr:uncharacterized protein LOC111019038 [Momordica charantia]
MNLVSRVHQNLFPLVRSNKLLLILLLFPPLLFPFYPLLFHLPCPFFLFLLIMVQQLLLVSLLFLLHFLIVTMLTITPLLQFLQHKILCLLLPSPIHPLPLILARLHLFPHLLPFLKNSESHATPFVSSPTTISDNSESHVPAISESPTSVTTQPHITNVHPMITRAKPGFLNLRHGLPLLPFSILFQVNPPLFGLLLNVLNGKMLWLRNIKLWLVMVLVILSNHHPCIRLLDLSGYIKSSYDQMERLRGIKLVWWLAVLTKLVGLITLRLLAQLLNRPLFVLLFLLPFSSNGTFGNSMYIMPFQMVMFKRMCICLNPKVLLM